MSLWLLALLCLEPVKTHVNILVPIHVVTPIEQGVPNAPHSVKVRANPHVQVSVLAVRVLVAALALALAKIHVTGIVISRLILCDLSFASS